MSSFKSLEKKSFPVPKCIRVGNLIREVGEICLMSKSLKGGGSFSDQTLIKVVSKKVGQVVKVTQK